MATLIYVETSSDIYPAVLSIMKTYGWMAGNEVVTPPPKYLVINATAGSVSYTNNAPGGASISATALADIAAYLPIITQATINTYSVPVPDVSPFVGTDQYHRQLVFVPASTIP